MTYWFEAMSKYAHRWGCLSPAESLLPDPPMPQIVRAERRHGRRAARPPRHRESPRPLVRAGARMEVQSASRTRSADETAPSPDVAIDLIPRLRSTPGYGVMPGPWRKRAWRRLPASGADLVALAALDTRRVAGVSSRFAPRSQRRSARRRPPPMCTPKR
jgi:hypothetical protein